MARPTKPHRKSVSEHALLGVATGKERSQRGAREARNQGCELEGLRGGAEKGRQGPKEEDGGQLVNEHADCDRADPYPVQPAA